MPRPGPRLPIIAVRFDPAPVDAEAEIETVELGRAVTRSEMMKTLITEGLAARQRRRTRRTT